MKKLLVLGTAVGAGFVFFVGSAALPAGATAPAASVGLVSDVNPGAAGSSPDFFTPVGGILFFVADDGTHGLELWRSDGTAAGTTLVKDIDPNPQEGSGIGGPGGAGVGGLVNVNGTLFFAAGDGTTGLELWRSDGTAAGTVLVRDILPGGAASGSTPLHLTNVGGTLFFTADDGSHGRELWRSDGTAAGTTMVSDINPGSNGSNPTGLVNIGGTLFFHADDGVHGDELWRSDGTSAGTTLVKDVYPGAGGSIISEPTAVNGTLYFSAFDGNDFGLWKSDGTAGGTVLVKYLDSVAEHLTNVAGTLFFSADQGSNGRELWRSDGTAFGTAMVADIFPGPAPSDPDALTAFNGMVFFQADDGSHGVELWRSDGTAGGTTLVSDLNPGSADSGPDLFASSNGRLYFAASEFTDGRELWTTDGTAAGTYLVGDIDPGGTGSFPSPLADVNGTLFFGANDGSHGDELWKLAVTPPPTVVTGAATAVSTDGATLNGTVNPNGSQISDCHFEYGTTQAYDSRVPCSSSPGAGTAPVAVSAALSGLGLGKSYDYRLVATGPGGTVAGDNATLTTATGPASTTLTTSQTAGLAHGASITVPPGTAGESDEATITGDNAFMAAGTVTFALYSDPQCTQASQVFTSTNRTAGNPQPFALADSDPVNPVLTAGTYYWTAAYSGDSRNEPSSSPCGAETLTVESLTPGRKPTTVSTSQTAGIAQGASITVPFGTSGESDHATITGDNTFMAGGTVTFALYSDPQCTQASEVFTSTNRTAGNPQPFALADSGHVDARLDPGTYYWTATYSGDDRNEGSSSPCGSETLTIQPLPPPPPATTISTVQVWGDTRGASITIPGSATNEHDEATLSGVNAATSSGSLTFNLYRSTVEGPQCNGTPVFTSTRAIFPIFGGGTSSNPITTPLAPGTYYWSVSYSGDLANQASTSTCGDEVLTVQPPQPTTISTVQVWQDTRGASITVPGSATNEHDEAQLSGANASSSSGNLTFNLYRRAGDGPQCTGTPAFSSTRAIFPIFGGGTSSNPVPAPLAPGTYDWSVSYSGDLANQPSTSACGDEVLTVQPPQPTTLSTVQVWQSTRGASITVPSSATNEHDEAQLSGANASSSSGSFTFNLYRRAAEGPQCTGTPVFTSTRFIFPIFGGGTSSDPVPTQLAAGTYYWTVDYGGDADNQPSTSPCGAEVLTVPLLDHIGYSVDAPTVAGPPYPTAPVTLRSCGNLGDRCAPVELLGLSLVTAPGAFRLDAAVPPDPTAATPAAIPPGVIQQSFDMLVSFAQNPDATVAPVLTPPTSIVPPSPIKAFDVRYLVFLPNVAVSTETLHYEIAANQPYVFTNVAVSPPHSPRFDVSFTLEPTGGAQQPGALWTVTPSATIAGPDATPPVLTVPASVAVDATSDAGAAVTYTATATDDLDPSPKVACTPAPGATFPIGDTTVRCTATDAGGNTANASFTVHVRGAGEQIAALIAKTRTDLRLPAASPTLLAQLQLAADALVAKKTTLACTLLNVYITVVKLTPISLLTETQKADLVADATRIRAVIGC